MGLRNTLREIVGTSEEDSSLDDIPDRPETQTYEKTDTLGYKEVRLEYRNGREETLKLKKDYFGPYDDNSLRGRLLNGVTIVRATNPQPSEIEGDEVVVPYTVLADRPIIEIKEAEVEFTATVESDWKDSAEQWQSYIAEHEIKNIDWDHDGKEEA